MSPSTLGLIAELACIAWGVLALLLGVIEANGRFATLLNIAANTAMVIVGLQMHLAFPVVQGCWVLVWIVNGVRMELKK